MGVLGFLRLGQRKGVTSKGDQAEDDDLDDEFVLGPLPPRALEPLQPRAPRSTRRPKLTDDDREVFQYARNLTLRNVWRVQWSGYYRDRLNTPRGPCTLPTLRGAWIAGVIDEHTLVWGQGLVDWLPVRNVRTLVPQIRTLEVQLATFLKRKFALEPALKAVRRQREQERPGTESEQVRRMF